MRLRRDARGLLIGDWSNGAAGMLVVSGVILVIGRPDAFGALLLGAGLVWLAIRNSGTVTLTDQAIRHGTRVRRRSTPHRDIVGARTGHTFGLRGVQLVGIDLVLHNGAIEHLKGSVNLGIHRHHEWIDAINDWAPPRSTRARVEVFLMADRAVLAASDLTTSGDWHRSAHIDVVAQLDAASLGHSINAALTRSTPAGAISPSTASDEQNSVQQSLLQAAGCGSWPDLVASSRRVVVLRVATQRVVVHYESSTRSPESFTENVPQTVMTLSNDEALGTAVLAGFESAP